MFYEKFNVDWSKLTCDPQWSLLVCTSYSTETQYFASPKSLSPFITLFCNNLTKEQHESNLMKQLNGTELWTLNSARWKGCRLYCLLEEMMWGWDTWCWRPFCSAENSASQDLRKNHQLDSTTNTASKTWLFWLTSQGIYIRNLM